MQDLITEGKYISGLTLQSYYVPPSKSHGIDKKQVRLYVTMGHFKQGAQYDSPLNVVEIVRVNVNAIDRHLKNASDLRISSCAERPVELKRVAADPSSKIALELHATGHRAWDPVSGPIGGFEACNLFCGTQCGSLKQFSTPVLSVTGAVRAQRQFPLKQKAAHSSIARLSYIEGAAAASES